MSHQLFRSEPGRIIYINASYETKQSKYCNTHTHVADEIKPSSSVSEISVVLAVLDGLAVFSVCLSLLAP